MLEELQVQTGQTAIFRERLPQDQRKAGRY